MGESNTVISAYTVYRHLQQYCSPLSICIYICDFSDVNDEGGVVENDSRALYSYCKIFGKNLHEKMSWHYYAI